MSSHFAFSVLFLHPTFHGRRNRGEAEWPPSPLRAYQSLVAAAAVRCGRGGFPSSSARSALEWLASQPPPMIVAPAVARSSGYRLSVPNNAMDIVAAAWSRGNYSNSGDANPATHRAMKTVRPTWLLDGEAVHYLWPLADPLSKEIREHAANLSEFARSVIALGWGVDMAVGHGSLLSQEDCEALHGERWLAGHEGSEDGLRIPVRGTLDGLIERHTRFLDRLRPQGLVPPPPLSAYQAVEYRRVSDPERRPVAAFALLRLDGSGFRVFDPVRCGLTLAGMMRHAATLAARQSGWPEDKIGSFVLGHGESRGDGRHVAVGPRRFAYLPLPSIEARGEGKIHVAGSVRRIILSTFSPDPKEVDWARRTLSGRDLLDEATKCPVAMLSAISAGDNIVRCYADSAARWATVTPVVLPGFDDPSHYRRRIERGIGAEEQKHLLDRLAQRTDALLRKAIVQAGFSQSLADHARVEWRSAGFRPGVDLASRYGAPGHLRRFPRLHVRICWQDVEGRPLEVRGPICIGGGRYYGLGLFVAEG